MITTTYLAITIGPIYKTLLQARKEREIWIASYFFSLIMEEIVSELKSKGNIIIPATPDKSLTPPGAGIYPDRLIMTLNNDSFEAEKFLDSLFEKLSGRTGMNVEYLKNYLQIYHILISQEQLDKFSLKDKDGKEVISFIHKLNHLLNIQELKAKYNPTPEAFFNDLFKIDTLRKLYKKAYPDEPKRHFPSILEISAKDSKFPQDVLDLLYMDDEELKSEELTLKNEKIQMLTEKHKKQKYIAIINADGDNMGEVISELKNSDQDVNDFSQKLAQFSQEAAKIITNYGGEVIYIGGDDILCMAPIVHNGSNVFQLIKDLNINFHQVFSDEIYTKNAVSLSYGLSLTYYKYPLNEALELSRDLLKKAKKIKDKNCMVFQLLQHSGQYRETILKFEKGNSFDSFLKMLNDFSNKENLLQSLTHKFVDDKEMFLAIAGKKERIEGYFNTHFSPNEKGEDVKEFIKAVKENLVSTFDNFKGKHEEAIQQMNTICRILKFLSNDEQNNS